MKQNFYLFSNSILRRKNNTILFETEPGKEHHCKADMDSPEIENLMGTEDCREISSQNKKFVPAENIESIYTFGDVEFNSRFLGFVSQNFIPVHVFNYYGNYSGSFLPKSEINSGNILINQVEHYQKDLLRLNIAKQFIVSAGMNALANVKYYLYRDAPLQNEVEIIKKLVDMIPSAMSVGELMGIEGSIKSTYYKSWNKIFKNDVDFEKRVKRPPDNMINSLISFGNVMVYTACLNEIYRTGLNPSIGFLHSTGDNRLPLSFDIAETYKPLIVDRTIFRMVNLNMINEQEFFKKGDKLYMKDSVKKIFVEEIENKLKTTIMHPELKRNVSYKTLIRLDCYNLINHLKGESFFKGYIANA